MGGVGQERHREENQGPHDGSIPRPRIGPEGGTDCRVLIQGELPSLNVCSYRGICISPPLPSWSNPLALILPTWSLLGFNIIVKSAQIQNT